ncbi:MAG: GreA/GreB family elongation factor [Ignavibacteriales bacterium]
MSVLKLLPEQVETLHAEAAKLNEQYLKLLEEQRLEDKVQPGWDLQGITDIGDNLTISKLRGLKNRIKTIDAYLSHYQLVDKYESEKVSIGTEFTVYMDFGNNDNETDTYRLVYTNVSSLETRNYISIDCPLGESVLNKKVGDKISYLTPAKKEVKGVILDILPEKTVEQAKEKSLI